MIIALAALVVRCVWTVCTSAGIGELRGDAIDYFTYAVNLGAGHGFISQGGMRAMRMPMYPAFLAAVFAVAGASVAAAQAVQTVIGAATCALIYVGAAAWLSPAAALVAGWAATTYFGLISPCGRVLTECLYAFWLSTFFAAWFHWRPQARWTGALAALAAALYLTRPEGLFVGLVVAAMGPWAKRGWRWVHSAVLCACLAAAVMGWGLRNKSVLGSFMPGTTNAGWGVWFAIPRTLERRFLPASEQVELSAPDPDELANYGNGWRRSRETLARATPLLILKAAAFNFVSIYYPFLPNYELTLVLWMPLWAFAFWALRGRRELWPLFALLAGWSFLYMIVGGADSRFRQAFAPLLLLLAAGGWESLRSRLSPQSFNKAAAAWVAANLLVFFLGPHMRQGALALRWLLWGG